ncbi:hypothetical protein CP982_04170 [Streptomyces spectabilis]|uniref:Uncharacterized protein n=1 Tax=Streptomyces spectabilis TaxID=68270 RepID=A0A5P2X4B8_STRST|nr:hypothetical protein CP982_04170 [Streptomyces spectabilis]
MIMITCRAPRRPALTGGFAPHGARPAAELQDGVSAVRGRRIMRRSDLRARRVRDADPMAISGTSPTTAVEGAGTMRAGTMRVRP